MGFGDDVRTHGFDNSMMQMDITPFLPFHGQYSGLRTLGDLFGGWSKGGSDIFGGWIKDIGFKDVMKGLGGLGTIAAPFLANMFKPEQDQGGGPREFQVPPQRPMEEFERPEFGFGEMMMGFQEMMGGQRQMMQDQLMAQQEQMKMQQAESQTLLEEEAQKNLAQQAAGHRADFQARTGSALTADLAALEMGVPLEELLAALEAFGPLFGWSLEGSV